MSNIFLIRVRKTTLSTWDPKETTCIGHLSASLNNLFLRHQIAVLVTVFRAVVIEGNPFADIIMLFGMQSQNIRHITKWLVNSSKNSRICGPYFLHTSARQQSCNLSSKHQIITTRWWIINNRRFNKYCKTHQFTTASKATCEKFQCTLLY